MICVDWAAGAVDPNYVRAAVNTRLVGKQVTLDTDKFKLLANLIRNHQVALLIRPLTWSSGTSTTTPIWLASRLALMFLALLGRSSGTSVESQVD